MHFGGVYTVAAVSPNTQYTFSCYLKGHTPTTLRVSIAGLNNGQITINSGSANFGLSTTNWTRQVTTFTTGTGITSVRIYLGEVIDAGYKFYTDGWVLEPGSAASPFSLNFAGVNVGYDVSRLFYYGAEALALSGWGINPAVGGSFGTLTCAQTSASLRLYYSAANVMRMRLTGDTGATQDVAVSWSTPSTWALWTAVISQSGSPNMWLYKNGVLIGKATAASMPELSQINRFYLGNNNGLGQWVGYLDEVMIYPYAPSQAMLAGLASLSTSPPMQPQLTLDGDIVGGLPVSVIGSEVKTTYAEGAKALAWRSNLARVQFTLTEV
jgi:hypothetical protein